MARCLDGTPAIYYSRAGAERTKYLIFFEGGGFCSDTADCADRAKTYLGSTSTAVSGDKPTLGLTGPYFSEHAARNPLLHNFTKVYVRYCDGAYYSGERTDEVKSAAGKPLYFRGRFITEAIIADLTAHAGLGDATDIVLAGCSAGAIRIYAHLDTLRGMLPPRARVVGFPDSGFYVDVAIFTPLKQFVVDPSGQNATAMLNRRCAARYPDDPVKCLIASAAVATVQTPIFAWQSRYDADQRTCEINATCAANDACINAYGANLTAALESQLLASRRNGAFLDGCWRHCTGLGKPHSAWPTGTIGITVDGTSPLQALAKWYAGSSETSFWHQAGAYPCKNCCGA